MMSNAQGKDTAGGLPLFPLPRHLNWLLARVATLEWATSASGHLWISHSREWLPLKRPLAREAWSLAQVATYEKATRTNG